MKCYDLLKSDESEGTRQGRALQSRTTVGGSKRIRDPRSLNLKRCRLGMGGFWFEGETDAARCSCRPHNHPPHPWRNLKRLGSGGSMVARTKLKGIDGRAPPGVEPAAQFDSTRGNSPGPDRVRNDRLKIFHDSLGGGAWPFLVGGVICLVDSVNERDAGLC